MRVVVDTNVVVSALLGPGRVPDRALASIFAGRAALLYDARILLEYRTVLGRPKFQGVDPARREELLEAIVTAGLAVGVVAPWAFDMPDPDDRMFV